MRSGQSLAAAQPSSMTINMSPGVPIGRHGFATGCATASTSRPAKAILNRMSQSGADSAVRLPVSSPNSSRVAGKATRRGAGGIAFSSHHSSGSRARATSAQGARKASGPSVAMAAQVTRPARST